LLTPALLAVVAACPKQEAPKALPPEVLYATVTQKDVPIGIEAVGQTRGSQEVQVRPQISGTLTAIDFTEGQPIKKGQLLYEIDDRTYRATVDQMQGQLEQAKARLLKADQDVARYTPLVAQKAVSQMELDNAKAAQLSGKGDVAAAQGNLKDAQAKLSYCRISSPTDGIAGISSKSVGNLVSPADPDPLTNISQIDPIWVRVSIPEAQYLQMATRQRERRAKGDTTTHAIQMVLADGTIFPHVGKLRALAAQVDPTTGTVPVDITFPNPDRILRSGQFARVMSVSEVIKGALVIPQRAIQELQGTSRVAVIGAGDTVTMKTITTGQRVGNFTVVTAGLAAGDRVVVEGLQRIKPGGVVRPTLAPPPSDSSATPAAGAAPPGAPPAAPPGAPPADTTKKTP
jgi:membrane fusion protein (multidrug efflux system)